ncbi:MAG: Nramp family divalent metal transporter [Spirochaetota bacterium]
MDSIGNAADEGTVSSARAILEGGGVKGWKRILPFLGPAFIASIAYVDPGNFATNIEAGSRFGYLLLWVIFASNLMAMLIQSLSAKLGIVTGKNLAEHCRESLPPLAIKLLWVLMELVAMATDLAEFIGAALGFQILFGIPLIVGGILTVITTFMILGLERYGFRPLEAVITAFLGVIALCYVFETLVDRPDWAAMGMAFAPPRFDGPESVVLAAGILGATVMPHAIFLHSALMQGRIRVSEVAHIRKLLRFERVDVLVAMGIASLVNAAMLVMSAATFHATGHAGVAGIEEASRTLEPLLGKASSIVFGLSLLASGLASSTVGTSAGQIIMQGFIRRQIPIWLRRVITVLPSLAVIIIGLDPTKTLVASQVLLSFGLPFVVIPLVVFTSDRKRMGIFANSGPTKIAAIIVSAIIVSLNLYLIMNALK